MSDNQHWHSWLANATGKYFLFLIVLVDTLFLNIFLVSIIAYIASC